MKNIITFILVVLVFLSVPSFAETEISGGFSYHNVSIVPGFMGGNNGFEVIGEMDNNSGKDYTMASFSISLYDESGALLSIGHANINNFLNGQTKSFQAIIVGIPMKDVKKYKVQFDVGM